MIFVVFLALLSCNYVIIADIEETSKIVFFSLVAIFFLIRLILAIF